MLDTLRVLPAVAGDPADAFPFRLRVRLRDKFGLLLRELRKRSSAFRSLEKGPWFVLLAIASHFELNEEAWPGQESIAETTGYCSRAVRFHVAELESGGFLVLRRKRRRDGGERIFYGPGPVLLRELAAFDRDYPQDRARAVRPVRAVVPSRNNLPEDAAGTPAEGVSMEPDHEQKEPSSYWSAAPRVDPCLDEEEQPSVTSEDRELARCALAERMKRKRPKLPPPRWFDRSDVEMVARCSAAVEGGKATKQLALRDAITGAFSTSKDGPPSARFIWEKLEHFFDHLERGRGSRLAQERAARAAAAPSGTAPTPRQVPAPIPDEARAELERIFGPRRSASHVGA